jgi:hypothetical protein
MRRTPALLAVPVLAALLAGCPAFDGTPYSYDADGENCHLNNPPAVGNVELNSIYFEEELKWMVSIHFDWVDPGVQGAEDPPNMVLGQFSIEFFRATTEDITLTREHLEGACVPGPEGDPSVCAVFGHSMGGCPDAITCSQGELTVPYQPLDFDWVEDEEIELEFRVRDACGAVSNEKSATYTIGSGLAVEGGGGDDDDGG